MRIGTQFLGDIDSLGKEGIRTKFFILGLPIIPLESYYCLESGYRNVRGFPIDTNGRSVLVAYLFWWISFPLILGGGLLFFTDFDNVYCVLMLISGLIFGFIVNRIARLSKPEKRRRTIFNNITGMGAPPELLPQDTRRDTLAALEKLWQTRTSDPSLQDWRNAVSLDDFDASSLLILYCLASYAEESSLASEIWQRIETSGEPATSKARSGK